MLIVQSRPVLGDAANLYAEVEQNFRNLLNTSSEIQLLSLNRTVENLSIRDPSETLLLRWF